MKRIDLMSVLLAVIVFLGLPAGSASGDVDGQLLADQVSELILRVIRSGEGPVAGGIGDGVLTYLDTPDYVWASPIDHRYWDDAGNAFGTDNITESNINLSA